MKVLVVDDDAIARELLSSELTQAGHETLSLPSPIGVTRFIQEQNVEVVIIDVVMPSLRGDRLAKLLRGNPKFSKLVVILVSGESEVELQRLASSVGADAVISKRRIPGTVAGTVRAATRARAAKAAEAPHSSGRSSSRKA
jgi:DNA-binding response OmpR family regulator